MNKFLFIVLALTAYHSGNTSQDGSWRKYFAPEDALAKGYVKKTIINSNQGDLVYYDKVFLKENEIILRRFDSSLKILREDVNDFDSEKMVLTKATYYYDGVGAVPAKIIEPLVAPYKPTNKTLSSHIEYKPIDNITISLSTRAKYLGNESYIFYGEEVDCIKISYDEEYRLTNTEKPSENINHRTNGYTLWGKDIGLIYMKFEDQAGISEFAVVEILTLNEFEKLKL